MMNNKFRGGLLGLKDFKMILRLMVASGFDWSDMAEEQVQTNMALMMFLDSEFKREVACKDYEINVLKSEFEKVKQEKEGMEFKIEKFDKASKDLDKLLGSQITEKSKKGLGYSAVPPPHPLIYNRPKKLDLSYSGLDEFKEPEFKAYGSKNSKQESNIIRYALTVNPTIYTSCIEQFWATTKANTINGERQLQALIDKKKVIITETSIRSDLHLEDAGGTDCLPTATIFEELAIIGRKQRKDTAVTQEETQQDDNVPTPSNDPPLSDEDSMQLTELMILCTNLQKQVLDLEKAKDAQEKEIADLKKRVQKLEKKKKSRTIGLKRLRKIGMPRRVKSSEDKDSLGDHEDASKQGRSIEDIDKDADVSLVDDTHGRSDDAEMFDTNELHGDEVVVDMLVDVSLVDDTQGRSDDAKMFVTNELHGDEVVVDMLVGEKQKQSAKEREVNTSVEDSATPTTIEEITLAQIHIQIKEAKPKVVTTAATTTTTTRPKARGVVVHKLSEFRTPQESQPSKIKDKGKAIMIEPEVPLKRKDQVALNEDLDELESDKSKKAESNEEKAKGSRKKILGKKRSGKEQQQESSKRQRMEDDKETDEHKEVEVAVEAKLKKHLVIVKDDEIAIDAIPLATKPPMIVEYKLLKEGILLVKTKHGDTRPEDEHERVFWGDLKVMFEPDIKSDVRRNLQGYTVTIWKLYDSCGVHFVSTAGTKVYAAGLQLLEDLLLSRG
ncbi:hypothetical protein Tco_0300458 [Tanacetum coccineum]